MPTLNAEGRRRDIITIGASAGGLGPLIRLFEKLPPDLPAAIAIVLHRSPTANFNLGAILCRRAALQCLEPQDEAPFSPGTIFVAPRDQHILVVDGRIRLDRGPKTHSTRPAVDPLFVSAAETYGPRVVGILLSGGGQDGITGLIEIKKAGGLSIAQDPEEAQVPIMPINAILRDHVDCAMTVDDIASVLPLLVKGERVHVPLAGSAGSR